VCCGRWTSDGKYFVFAATRDKQSNIWLLRERGGFFRPASKPFQLTHGPIGLYEPLPGTDGHTIFAQGGFERVVLERVDVVTRQVKPLLNSMPAWEIVYARNGQFALYDTNDAVWKMDLKGGPTEKVFQSTAAMQVNHMSVSNDGKIALFLGHPSGGSDVAMLAPISGGSPRALPALGHPYIVPDFSPDGRKIVAGPDWETANGSPEKTSLNIYTLDSGELRPVPGSQGLLGARWSPDGRYLAAFTADMRHMKLFDIDHQRWTDMTSGNYFSVPVWSSDSKWLYFQDLLDSGEPVFRMRPGDVTRERAFSFEDILNSGTQRCGFYGVAPDGAIVFRATRDGGDIFALDVDLP
jgi:Tol biopolymer transport system component